ncbi:SusC/RagA family TonB-linked outer membrane protein [Chitinophaga ginsengisoli]|uniref:TonB-linked SusC/RagA family outer membrane protein n=1 Tax=Chitinophaga ginsengisoli TaxID=363837 RepID=A0A2P8FQW7_9BACT|nr:SusC/RagA family TonB-linked outer membrane protein [Chitinophaga ginsengisoli]PSL24114.1 TonB-linked SusC/RagA family outer membrane protein [Chitinophaga ginsengisoli]
MQLYKRHASALYPMLLLQFSLYLSTAVIAQDTSSLAAKKVSFSVHNTTLHDIFDTIAKQTGLRINYSKELLDDREEYSFRTANEPVLAVANRLVNKKGFTCKVEGLMLLVFKTPTGTDNQVTERAATTPKTFRLHGQVLDSTGIPLPGATILIKGTHKGYTAKEDGQFFLSAGDPHPILLISYTGYGAEEYPVTDPDKDITVVLRRQLSPLDETVIIAYGTTSKRLNTGNVAKVAAIDIEKYPVSNPLFTLQGRVPGLTIYQFSGAPGTPLDIRLRVQNSFLSNNTPLIVVDGIPLPAGSQNINLLTAHPNSNVGLYSIFNNMDIASIEVLKDADATAIYGSRGGNGVIVITTKRGVAGKLKVRADYTMGVSQVSNKLRLLNTQQYLKVRREAFSNDGLKISKMPGDPGYAPDILSWDTTRYTDWQKWQIGGNAPTNNANLYLSGGNETTQMMVSLGYYREGTVYPSDMAYLRGTASFSFNHRSADNRFRLGVYTNYAKDRNAMFNSSLTAMLSPPDAPQLYDKNNQLNWIEGNEPFQNPAAEYLKAYIHEKENQIVNFNAEYSIIRDTQQDFKIKFNLGYNSTLANENLRIPKASQNPYLTDNITGTSSFGTNNFKSYLAEPQAEYYRRIKNAELIILAGVSFQYTSNYSSTIVGQGYTNDALLSSLDGAAMIASNLTNRLEYKYGAAFGRVTYKLRNKYIANLSGRRDGSSKFGPEHRFSNFGSLGAAWIFSEEPFIKEQLSFLSFGKLRSSFGVTGNDQIADYKFLDTWSPTLGNPYQNTTTMQPDALFNPAYTWERTKKIEAALELGFFKDRLIASFAYFRNRSDNQLIKYSLPLQTGFNSILKNFNALVQSSGWEFAITSDLIKSKSLTLNAAFNISIPRNKLLRFDNLANSSYAGTYVIGESLNVLYKLQSGGVSPDSGYFKLRDTDGNGHYTPSDYKVIGNLDPVYHGGFQLNLQYRRLSFSIAGEFRKQMVQNYLYRTYLNSFFPGMMVNQSDLVLDHWQQKGDIAKYPKYSTKPTGDVYRQKPDILSSSEAYSDGSFLKFRNVAVSYTMDMRKRKDKTPTQLTIFCNTQNLFTISKYKEGDPEVADFLSLPPLRTFAGGIRFSIQ